MPSQCVTSGCERVAFARSLCAHHYGKEYRAGSLERLERPGAHSLSNVDRNAGTADCAICGPTPIRVRRDGRGNECKVKIKEGRPSTRGTAKRSPQSTDATRQYKLRARFQMTPEQYGELLALQSGVCAICRRPENDGRHLAVDHDHSCCPGKVTCGRCVRGLLCFACNSALGRFNDDREVIARALAYLSQ